jgi:hypothetical protein
VLFQVSLQVRFVSANRPDAFNRPTSGIGIGPPSGKRHPIFGTNWNKSEFCMNVRNSKYLALTSGLLLGLPWSVSALFFLFFLPGCRFCCWQRKSGTTPTPLPYSTMPLSVFCCGISSEAGGLPGLNLWEPSSSFSQIHCCRPWFSGWQAVSSDSAQPGSVHGKI